MTSLVCKTTLSHSWDVGQSGFVTVPRPNYGTASKYMPSVQDSNLILVARWAQYQRVASET